MISERDSVQLEVLKSLNQLQEKYIFYIVALCVSAIGFSIYCTIGKHLNLQQIPLGFAVISWAVSIFCGLHFVKWSIEVKRTNFQEFDLPKIRLERGEQTYEYVKGILTDKKNKHSKLVIRMSLIQEYSFYSGVLFFLIWHILEMYLTK